MTLKDKMDAIGRELGLPLRGYDLFVFRGKKGDDYDVDYIVEKGEYYKAAGAAILKPKRSPNSE